MYEPVMPAVKKQYKCPNTRCRRASSLISICVADELDARWAFKIRIKLNKQVVIELTMWQRRFQLRLALELTINHIIYRCHMQLFSINKGCYQSLPKLGILYAVCRWMLFSSAYKV